jgi:DNA modification methylase/ParB-like chromosome segregation protein Spo0J
VRRNKEELKTENNNNKKDEIAFNTTTLIKTSIHRYQINNNSLITITVNSEFSNLVIPLSKLEYESLKNSIKEDGLHYPIVINSKGEILDGHHRYKICKEIGITPPQIKHEIKYFKDSIEEKKFVIDINLRRRQLNDFQRAELAYRLEEIEKDRAKLRQSILNNKETAPAHLSVSEIGETRDIVSKKVGISRGTYARAKTIIKYGSEETKKKLIDGKSSIFKESEKIRKDQKREELISQMNNNSSYYYKTSENNSVNLICNDFSNVDSETILDNSIDLIFTDPPYSEQYLYLYEDLARLAIRVLKRGGSLVTYVGNISLTEIIKIFASQQPGLKFWWQFVVKQTGGHQRIHARGIFARYKSLLWYVKGEKPNELVVSNNISDFIESSSPAKILHDWEQSPIEPEYVIKNLTLENHSMVLDPMMGLGTTGIASILLNRKFIGIEKNEEIFKIAQSRITKEELAKKGVRKRGEKT